MRVSVVVCGFSLTQLLTNGTHQIIIYIVLAFNMNPENRIAVVADAGEEYMEKCIRSRGEEKLYSSRGLSIFYLFLLSVICIN